VNVFSRITIGADAANPVRLAPSEWRNVFLDQQYQVRLGKKKIGVWTIKVDRAGVYEISLRRWPIEADAAISAGVPAYTGVDGSYVAGVALPIAKARLRVGSFDQTVPVTATDKAITFNVTLPVGNVDLQTWFRDANNVSIASAYYVYVKRL
jgi:hypothetical protein